MPEKEKSNARSNETEITRRGFVGTAAKAAAGVALGVSLAAKARAAGPVQPGVYKSILPQSVIGANEKIRTGHIGIGGMGSANLKFALVRQDMQPIAVCDLWPPFRQRAAAMVSSVGHAAPSEHVYLEEIMENKDVDAVVISTPDHWHCLSTLMACDAGKDIYCEKPLSTSIAEGRAMVKAVREAGVVFQAGTMQRSGSHFQEAVQLVQDGYIGKVPRVETWIHDNLDVNGMGNPPDQDPPEGLDWDRYLGWTPKVPFNPNRFIYNFRWFLDYSGGKMTDWGTHLLDIALWAMGQEKQPRRVTAVGGKLVLQDNRTTPDTLDVLYEFDDYILSFNNRVFNGTPPYGGNRHGIIFFGTKGTLRVDRSGFEVTSTGVNGGCEPMKKGGSQLNEPHWENFAQCVRDRKDPICDVDTIYNTTKICHMGTSAYVAGGTLEWDSERDEFTGRPRKQVRTANKFAYREYENGWKMKPPFHKDLA